MKLVRRTRGGTPQMLQCHDEHGANIYNFANTLEKKFCILIEYLRMFVPKDPVEQ